MIFNSNTTSLGIEFPVVEGYDCSTGVAKALIESARNDYSMFKAMLELDAREIKINNESAGYVNEAEISALQEAAAGGILGKIVDMLKSLGAKIKSIFSNFIARLNGLFMKDKDLVKKYKNQVLDKMPKIGKMEVTLFSDKATLTSVINTQKTALDDMVPASEVANITDLAGKYNEDKETMEKNYLSNKTLEKYNEDCKEALKTEKDKLEKFGININDVISFMENSKSVLTALNEKYTKIDTAIGKIVKNVQTQKKEYIDGGKVDEGKLTEFSNAYYSALTMQQCQLATASALINKFKTGAKLLKAVFMKAVTVNPDKLTESSIYADAIAEAAQNEVEDVISGAISAEELSDTCNASLNVKDADVSDDPDKLTYGPDKYTDDAVCVPTDGSIDSSIIGKVDAKKEEAMFGTLLY